MFSVREVTKQDLWRIAHVHRECFPEDAQNLNEALGWVKANWFAHPRTFYFVLEEEQRVVGYILWMEKGGFRKEAVWELEQIGIASSQRGKGGGKILIRESLRSIVSYLKGQGRTLKLVEVSTATSNEAQRLYRNTLGAEVEATLSDLYDGDEVIMVARNPQHF